MVQLGTIKIQTPNGPEEIPVWEPWDVKNPELRVGTPNGVGALNLRDPSEAELDQLRIQTANGTMAVSTAQIAVMQVQAALNSQNATIYLYEDIDRDGTPENIQTISLEAGRTNYSFPDIEITQGSEYWIEVVLENSDVTKAVEIDSIDLESVATWQTPLHWEDLQDETGVVHEDIAYTDHSDAGTLQQGYSYGSLTRGLVAYYPMERGQSTHLHDAALGSHAAIYNASWTNDSKIGNNALSFNGSDSYTNVDGSTTSLDNTTNGLTLAGWVKPNFDTSSGSGYVLRVSGGGNNNTGFGWGRNTSAGQLEFEWSDDRIAYDDTTNRNGEWTFVTCVADSDTDSVNLTLYLNGQEMKSGGVSGNQTVNDKVGIVLGNWSSNGADTTFNGIIDDIRIYNRALSEPEIQTLYELERVQGRREPVTQAVAADAQVSRYALDGDVTDSWGSNDGSVNGATSTNDAIYGQAYSFDGTDDNISTPTVVDRYPVTLSAWVSVDSGTSSYNHLVSTYDGNSGFYLQYRADNNNPSFRVNDDTNVAIADGQQDISNGAWRHLVGTYDGDTIRFFINGQMVDQSTNTNIAQGTDGELTICSHSDNTHYQFGTIDDVRIYDRALTPVEVEKLFHRGSYRINRKNVLD